jgi:hypothetical protein
MEVVWQGHSIKLLRCQGKLESLEEDGPEDEPEDDSQLNASIPFWTDS